MAHMIPAGPPIMTSDHPHMIPRHEHAPMIHLNPVNPELVHKIVQQIKINGIFDQMRKDCLADVDTRPAFLNLKQRVESHVKGILANQQWSRSLNKNQLRSRIRESVMQSGILTEGVDRILHQVFSAKVQSVFLPKVREFVNLKAQDIMKELMPPPPEVGPPMVVNPHTQYSAPPPIPGKVEQFHPPIPVQPPLPDSPVRMNEEERVNDIIEPPPAEELENQMPDTSEKILTYGDQEFYVKDEAQDDASLIIQDNSIVKAIDTPSPERHSPREEGAPKIPEDDVNPLRSLIQSILVSKQTLEVSTEAEDGIEIEGEVRVEEFSPAIDASQIESFTDEENDTTPAKRSSPEAYSPKPLASSYYAQTDQSSPGSQRNELYSPPSAYSPQSPEPSCYENRSVYTPPDREWHQEREANLEDLEEGTTLPYDPSKFLYEQMSDSTPVIEGSSSAPSPMDGAESQFGKHVPEYSELDCEISKTADVELGVQNIEEASRESRYISSSCDSSASSSDESMESASAETEKEVAVAPQETIEEMVEEIEVVEEYTSASEDEPAVQYESGDGKEKKEKKMPKAYQEKRKKKKAKKKKPKKTKSHKRARSSSISSGEITSSDTDISSSSRPSRPPRPPSREPQMHMNEIEERIAHRGSSIPDGRYWPNKGSASEYISSPRMHRPFSPPPGRPYSPDFRRFEGGREREREMRYAPPPGPPFRERPVYRNDYRSRTRFSPPPYRRSPPHRYSPGPRMDYPRMPFSSPRSPPRRPYSPPPHMYHGEPRPFPPPRHRWPSPPRPGGAHRMPSRSPPPGMRREDCPGPSRY